MRFSRQKKQPTVVLTPSQRINGDQLTNDASLKAAQAIFKMHTVPTTTSTAPKAAIISKERPQTRKTQVRTPKPAPKRTSVLVAQQKKTPTGNEKSSSAQAAAAQAAASVAHHDLVQIDSQLNLPMKDMNYLTPPYLRSNVSSRANSRSGSFNSQLSLRSGSSMALEDIMAKLQATNDHSGEHSLASPRGSSDFTKSSSKVQQGENSEVPASNYTVSADRLPFMKYKSEAHYSSPYIITESKNNSARQTYPGEMNGSLASSPSKSSERLTFRGSRNRSLNGRIPPPKEFLEDDMGSISSLESSRLSEAPPTNDEELSDIDLMEFGRSGNIEDYRHQPNNSISDQDRRSIDLNSSEVSYDALSKMPQQVQYRGTLPDLIPNHKRSSKMSKFKSLFGKKHLIEDNDPQKYNIVTKDDVTLVKTGQPVKFKTTMRKTSNDNEPEPSSDSDDSNDSSSEGDLPEKTKVKRRKKRVRIGRQIKKASHHHHSHRATFNEDKPWKSHIDIGFVTQAERKRYEGMWVSNRNCYLELLPWWNDASEADTLEEGLILNLVVLDIWSRSNLPQDRLTAIYDMVDTRGDGTLNRQSFIVGMWLVDQSLYGRKLPATIDQRVWDSVDKYIINVPSEFKQKLEHKRNHKSLKKEMKSLKKDLKRIQL